MPGRTVPRQGPGPASLSGAGGHSWQAALELGFARRPGRTVLAHRRRHGPLSVQRSFHPEGELCHVYLLHPPGGVVGGDRLAVDVQLDPDTQALITAPGAAKFYRSAGPTASLSQHLRIAAGASLEWLPHENILFDGARLDARIHLDLAPGARFIGWETHCLGRPASQAPFLDGEVRFDLRVARDGRPLLNDRQHLSAARQHAPAQLRGQPVLATLLATPASATLRDLLRDTLNALTHPSTDDAVPLPGPGGVMHEVSWGTTLLDDLLVLRLLAPSTAAARTLLLTAWQTLRPDVIGRRACPPRIWAT